MNDYTAVLLASMVVLLALLLVYITTLLKLGRILKKI